MNDQQTVVRDYLIASALQQVEVMCGYIETASVHPDATFEGKPTALCYAALHANCPLVRYLLRAGANASHRDGMGMTPLHYAAIGGSESCIESLIGAGAPVNAANHSGKTALALAAARGGKCCKILCTNGAVVACRSDGTSHVVH